MYNFNILCLLIGLLLNLLCVQSKIYSKLLAERERFVRGDVSEIFRDQKLQFRSEHDRHHIHRRDAENAEEKLKTKITKLEGSKDESLNVYWTGNQSSTILVVLVKRDKTADTHSHNYLSTTIYRSKDYGNTFQPLTIENSNIVYMIVSRQNSSKIIGFDNDHTKLHISTDGGDNWNTTVVPFHCRYVTENPHNPDMLISLDWMTSNLRLSLDFGATWILLHERANWHYYWAVPGQDPDNTTIHFEYQDERERSFYKSCAFPDCKGSDCSCKDVTRDKTLGEIEPLSFFVRRSFYKSCAFPDCKGSDCNCKDVTRDKTLGEIEPLSFFVSDNQYMFVQKSASEMTSDTYVSYNRGQFEEILLPHDLRADDAEILSTDDDMVMLSATDGKQHNLYICLVVSLTATFYIPHLSHDMKAIYTPQDAEILSTDDDMVMLSATDGKQHNLYISDETGRHFVTSMNNIFVVINKNYHFVDRFEISGSRGTFIVNQYLPASEKLVTRITFNKGVNWVPVPSPDSACTLASDCSLHFHLYAKAVITGSTLMWASSQAPGMILMHGASGRSLPATTLTSYFSRDGGVSWKKLFKGLHDFTMLDHGGAMIALENPASNTSYAIKYSCNEFDTIKVLPFTSTPIRVYDVKTEPGMSSLIVTLYGKTTEHGDWQIIQADFSSILKRSCNDSDYESWDPKAIYNGVTGATSDCILGSKFKLRRRKQDSECSNGRDYDKPEPQEENCTCAHEDYHCSYGHEGKDCTKASWYTKTLLTRDCPNNNKYIQPNRYRKIAGDRCTGGLDTNPIYKTTEKTCPITKPTKVVIVPSKSVVPTRSNVTFSVSQRWGTKQASTYTFDFGDKSPPKAVVGLVKAQTISHVYTATGIYNVGLTVSNSAGTTKESCIVTVEDEIWELDVDFPRGIRLNQVTTIVATVAGRMWHHANLSKVHYLWTFHFENHSLSAPQILTWNNTVTHVFDKPGTYHVTLQAINGVTIKYDEFEITVQEFVKIVKISFPKFVNTLSRWVVQMWGKAFLRLLTDKILEITEDDGERILVEVSRSHPVYGIVTILGKNKNDPFMLKAANAIVKEVKSPGIMLEYPHSSLKLPVSDAVILEDNHPPPPAKKSSNKVGIYVAIPVLFIAVIVVGFIFLYYRRKLKAIRRYALLQPSDEEENQLLGGSDDDEPPLDMTRRANDDELLDDHVTGIPGNRPALVLMSGSRRTTPQDDPLA